MLRTFYAVRMLQPASSSQQAASPYSCLIYMEMSSISGFQPYMLAVFCTEPSPFLLPTMPDMCRL